jgi:hypothetical protein
MDFCFSCCLVQKLRERHYVGNVPVEAVAVYCCTVFVSVSLSVYCCLWACCVQYDNSFLCLPCRFSVCLCVDFGYRVPVPKKCLSLIIFLYHLIQIPAMSDILLPHSVIIFRKEQEWGLNKSGVCLACGNACIRQY